MKRDDLDAVFDDDQTWAYWQNAKKKKEQKLAARAEKEKKIAEIRDRLGRNETNKDASASCQESQGASDQELHYKHRFSCAKNHHRGSFSWACSLMGVDENKVSLGLCRDAYVTLAKLWHPDAGGSTEAMGQLNAAWELLKAHLQKR